MNWLSKKEIEKTNLMRVKTRFLVFPKCIDGEYKWFEIATWKEHYQAFYDRWHEDNWVD